MPSYLRRTSAIVFGALVLSMSNLSPGSAGDTPPAVQSGWTNEGVEADIWSEYPNSGVWLPRSGGINARSRVKNIDAEPTPSVASAVDVGQAGPSEQSFIAACLDDRLVKWISSSGTLRSIVDADTVEVGGECDPEPAREVRERTPSIAGRIAERIVREFRRLPVVAGEVGLQPSPHTLRGAHTNIYAASRVQVFDVGLLGQDVRIVARPVAYRWSYGDGTSLGPVSASGGPLPAGRWGERTATSHVYGVTGDFSVVLTVTFEGTYSVNGGPAVPIPGTGEFSAPPRTISVWRSETRNYADDCNANPAGAGC